MADSEKILVVEDDETLRLLTTKQLSRLGFAADAVEDGLRALEKAKNTSYRLVLMDVQMPQMDGIEATIAIRAAEKEFNLKRVPIIAVTANPDRSLCLNADMDDFLFKPVMLPELQELLDKWLPKASPDASSETTATANLEKPAAPKLVGDNLTKIPEIEPAPKFGFASSSQIAAETTNAPQDVSAGDVILPPIDVTAAPITENNEVLDVVDGGPIID